MNDTNSNADTNQQSLPDTLNEVIGVLTRREVEARILAPVIEALGNEFGRDKVVAVLRDTIVKIAEMEGAPFCDFRYRLEKKDDHLQ